VAVLARARYDQAVQWMDENKPADEELKGSRAEGETLRRTQENPSGVKK
jgi:hypothetical protein